MVKLTIIFYNDKKEKLNVLTCTEKYLDPLSHFGGKKYELVNYHSTRGETTCEFVVGKTEEEFYKDRDQFTDKIPPENYVLN